MESERLSEVGLKTRMGVVFVTLVAFIMVLTFVPAVVEAISAAGRAEPYGDTT